MNGVPVRGALAEFCRDFGRTVTRTRPLGGGSDAFVALVELDDGARVVVKRSDIADAERVAEEATGLEALASTGTVRTPKIVGTWECDEDAVLVQEYLPETSPSTDDWRDFGRDLAALHDADPSTWSGGARYGFVLDNHLGATKQVNPASDDWTDFFAEARLRPLLELGQKRRRVGPDLAEGIENVMRGLPQWLPADVSASLVHGDLWSGNGLPTRDGNSDARIAVIDPAPSVSDGLVDIAMMKLFGGFPSSVFDEYFQRRPAPADLERRLALYQLHHVLNHVVIFGGGYAAQAESLAERVLSGR